MSAPSSAGTVTLWAARTRAGQGTTDTIAFSQSELQDMFDAAPASDSSYTSNGNRIKIEERTLAPTNETASGLDAGTVAKIEIDKSMTGMYYPDEETELFLRYKPEIVGHL
jgi:hypothetical protein